MAKKIRTGDFTELIDFLNKYGAQVVAEMQNRLKGDGKIATGHLSESIEYTLGQNKQTGITLAFVMEDYGKFVDKGVNGVERRRGSPYSFKKLTVGGKMLQQIGRWKKLKGIKASEWAIAKNIKKKGIAPTQFYTVSTTRRRKQLESTIEKLIDKALLS
jgi:hypothetical protein